MVEFMLIAAPRSGTTWAANWLTTDTTLCLHDPLFTHHYRDLDSLTSKKRLGVSCTGLYNFPEWVNAHPAKKVILHRSPIEVNSSLERLGLPALPLSSFNALAKLNGFHCDWLELFESPDRICNALGLGEVDFERHAQLRQMLIQPQFGVLSVNPAVVQQLITEVGGVV
jgi:hypothetical protein